MEARDLQSHMTNYQRHVEEASNMGQVDLHRILHKSNNPVQLNSEYMVPVCTAGTEDPTDIFQQDEEPTIPDWLIQDTAATMIPDDTSAYSSSLAPFRPVDSSITRMAAQLTAAATTWEASARHQPVTQERPFTITIPDFQTLDTGMLSLVQGSVDVTTGPNYGAAQSTPMPPPHLQPRLTATSTPAKGHEITTPVPPTPVQDEGARQQWLTFYPNC